MKGRVLRPDVVRGDLRVFQVDGIQIHADGEGTDLPAQELCRNGTDQAGIQTAGEQEAQRRVRVQSLFHPGDQLFPDVFADRLQIIGGISGDCRQISIADKALPVIITSRREGENTRAEALQVLRFAGKGNAPVGEIAIVKGADPDGIPCSDQSAALSIIQDQSEFRVQLVKHAKPVFPVQRQQQLTVGIAGKGIALRLQLPPLGSPAVEFAVADQLFFPS